MAVRTNEVHVGRYVIHDSLGLHDPLGRGDPDLLFRARDPSGGPAAVKVLRSLSGARPRACFLALAWRLSRLRHPNLVPVLDYGDQPEAPYLAMEYLPGGSLADLLRLSRLSQPGVLWVLRGIAAGIDHAHRSGLVHGALRPSQVVLDDEDRPVVTDLGLAPLRWPGAGGASALLERDAPYAAPELVGGGPPTAAADRYAYATIAFELLTGRTPFRGEPRGVLRAHLDTPPPTPSSVDPALTPALDAVILRGLARDPRARWRSCAELAEALAAAMSTAGTTWPERRGAPIVPVPVQAAAAARVPLPRRALGLVGILLTAAVAGGAAETWMAAHPPAVAMSLSSATASVGDVLVLTATELPADQAGMVELHSDPEQVGTFRSDPHGNVRVEVVVPQDALPGEHVLTLCWDGGCHGSTRLRVMG
jgi:eukaryotic-like serine/threonine-protein kinase